MHAALLNLYLALEMETSRHQIITSKQTQQHGAVLVDLIPGRVAAAHAVAGCADAIDHLAAASSSPKPALEAPLALPLAHAFGARALCYEPWHCRQEAATDHSRAPCGVPAANADTTSDGACAVARSAGLGFPSLLVVVTWSRGWSVCHSWCPRSSTAHSVTIWSNESEWLMSNCGA